MRKQYKVYACYPTYEFSSGVVIIAANGIASARQIVEDYNKEELGTDGLIGSPESISGLKYTGKSGVILDKKAIE